MMKKPLLIVISCVLFLGVIAWYVQNQQPTQYRLEIINRSDYPVQQVLLFGSALMTDVAADDILPERSALITTSLYQMGELRFQVSQQGNRIDTLIASDVSAMEQGAHQLRIEKGGRYILAPFEGLSLAD
jgi:hypothetical protein